MFEKENFSSRSKMLPIQVSDVFEDIVICQSKGINSQSENDPEYNKYRKMGYLPLDPFNQDLSLIYLVKPTQAVQDHMSKIGYEEARLVEHCKITNAIRFSTIWENQRASINTTWQIAGVVDKQELDKFKSAATIKTSQCIIKRAFDEFNKTHPNYHYPLRPEPTKLALSMARKIWIAVGIASKDDTILNKANNGDFDLFFKKLSQMRYLKEKHQIPVIMPKNEKGFTP